MAEATPSRRRRSRVITGIKVAFAVAALGFIVYSLIDQRDVVGAAMSKIGVLPVLHSFGWALVGLVLSAFAWREGLAALGHRLGLRASARMFFVSQAGKYLPGSVWPILAQIEIGHHNGVPRPRSGAAGVLFLVLHLTTGLVVALACLPFVGRLADSPYAVVGWLVVPALALLVPPVLTRVLNLGLRLIRRPPLERPLGWGDVLRPSGLLILMWLTYAASLNALLLGVGGLTVETFLGSLGAFALAWCAGFLFVVAPAGIGIREAVLVLVFAPLVGAGTATAVAALLRVTHTAGDLVLAVASGALRPRRPPPPTTDADADADPTGP